MVGFVNSLNARVSNSDSTATRSALYHETFDATLHSPLLGYGAPRPSNIYTGAPSLGTQGQIWTLMYSHGFPGAGFFLGGFLVLAWRTRRCRTTAELWLHTVVVMAIVMVPFYRMLGQELVTAMAAAAIVLRDDGLRRRVETATAAARQRVA
jgi:polysaccharide biosynthesis protein PslJ